MHKTYLLRFWEGENGPYELKGNAFACYRGIIHLQASGGHMRCEILNEDGSPVSVEQVMEDSIEVTTAMLEEKRRVH